MCKLNFKIIKLRVMTHLFFAMWSLQRLVRKLLNGHTYPCNAQREKYQCAKPFKDGIYIGGFAWKYLSEFNVGHLRVKIASPYKSSPLFFTSPLNDLTICVAKSSLDEIECYLNY